jgi:hypothetical protein
MAALTDHQCGWVVESVFGTPLTVTRFAPFMESSKLDFDAMPLQGTGLWAGSPGGVDRADRRFAGIGQAKGSLIFEAASKGLGNFIQSACGTGTHTLVSGSTFQQVMTPTVAGAVLPSLTIQQGVTDNTGTVNPETFAGCTVTDWQLEIPRGAGPDSLAKWTFNIDGKTLSTATGLATFAPPAGATLYSWAAGGIGTAAITVGGTLTPATTTALASVAGGTVSGNFGGITLKSDNNVDIGRWVPGGRNQPTVGKRKHTIQFDYEYTDNTYRALQISQGVTSLLIDIPTSEALSTGTARLQIAVPAMKIDAGALPEPTKGDTVVTQVSASILWDGTNQPFQIVQRTADTVI